jgi:sugar lactone lactonase YvrE
MSGLTTLSTGGHFFEGPRWHEGQWFVSDFYRHAVFAVDEHDGTQTQIAEVAAQPSGLGWLPDGSMVIASMRDRRVLRRTPDGSLSVHADVSEMGTGKLNDLVVSEAGDVYVGGFGFDLMAAGDPAPHPLIRVAIDGTASVVADDLLFPNGAVITPDGSTLIVAETLGCRLSAFDIRSDGNLGERRTFAQLAPTPEFGTFESTLPQVLVGPDGICLDAEGGVWVADAIGGRCIRVVEGGEITDEVAPGDTGVFACALGGTDGRTLLLCCAPDFAEQNRMAAAEATLRTTTVAIPAA